MSRSIVLVRGLQGPCGVDFPNTFYALSDTQNLGVRLNNQKISLPSDILLPMWN